MNPSSQGNAAAYLDGGLAIVGLIATFLATALVLEFSFDMEPCALCLTQRVFFMIAGLFALVGMGVHRPSRAWPIATGITTLMGMGFALRQLYLYLLPPEQVPSCGAPISRLIEYAPFMEVFNAMTQGTVNCAEASFPLLGMDMPGYFLPLGALAGFLLVLALVIRQIKSIDDTSGIK